MCVLVIPLKTIQDKNRFSAKCRSCSNLMKLRCRLLGGYKFYQHTYLSSNENKQNCLDWAKNVIERLKLRLYFVNHFVSLFYLLLTIEFIFVCFLVLFEDVQATFLPIPIYGIK